MPGAPIPELDDERLSVLARYKILDTEAEEVFDRITLLAKSIFDTKIALVSLVDRNRQWFKSCAGLDATETPRDQAFCGYAILQPDVFVVEDATKDSRFADNPLVLSDPKIRFYAGAPLVTHDGHALGTLCILDTKPRHMQNADIQVLKELSNITMNEIELKILKFDDKKRHAFENRDTVTDAFNQKTFKSLFDTECARSHRYKTPLSLAVFSMDHLDSIESALGSEACDLVVKSFQNSSMPVLRPKDIFARVSQDQFALLLPKTKVSSAEFIVHRILRRIKLHEPEFEGTRISYTVTAGLAQLSPSQKAWDFYKEAEKNQLTAKETNPKGYVASFAAQY